MTTAAAVVLSVLLVSFVLFVSGRVKPDLVAMLVLVSLVLARVIDPADAFAGFSSFAVITIAGLMVIGYGLEKTGVVQWVARRLERVINERYNRLLLVNTGIPGLLSGFVNIVATASFFIPVILRLSKQMKVPQSKILLPMACAALMGANLSLIGASHNLVVDSLLEEATGEGFSFFEFTPVGAVLLIAGLLFIFTLGRRLLPGEEAAPEPEKVPITADLVEVYELEDRLFEAWVSGEVEEGELTLAELGLAEAGITPNAAVREGESLIVLDENLALQEGDMLLLQGREAVVESFAEAHSKLTFIGPPKGQEKYPLSTAELAEAVVPPRSPAVGKTVRDLDLKKEWGMTAIAYYRDDRPHRTGPEEVELQEGDSLLLYGPRDR
ncbi:MAG: SLC13 family permease, partial [Thermoanaerobaculia bacterium]|nr:SLC13 family permease [Thermoanaerobaculia bacterium]